MSVTRRCNGICHNAKGENCRCWCGGMFHGAKGKDNREAFKAEFGITVETEEELQNLESDKLELEALKASIK